VREGLSAAKDTLAKKTVMKQKSNKINTVKHNPALQPLMPVG
jgi:hypothetical protein